MRPNVQMAFACENVSSEAGGPVSFQNVMDGIAADEFPAPSGRWCAIFCFFSDVAGKVGNCRVVIDDERGEILAQTSVKDMTFTAGDQMSRNVVRFQGLAWPYPGRYFVKFIANKNDVLAFFPMWVQPAPEPPPSSTPTAETE
jgi:hypothetical protein